MLDATIILRAKLLCILFNCILTITLILRVVTFNYQTVMLITCLISNIAVEV